MTKYKASNQNVPPAESRPSAFAAVVETMVSSGLLFSVVFYVLFPAMIGGHVFHVLTSLSSIPVDAVGDVTVTLPAADAKGLLWLCAFAAQLAIVAMVTAVVLWLLPSRRFPNFALLVRSLVLLLAASGDLVRSAAVKVPEGASLPILPLARWIDFPAVATEGLLPSLSHNAVAPFMLVGAAGMGVGFYRMGAHRISKRLAASGVVSRTV